MSPREIRQRLSRVIDHEVAEHRQLLSKIDTMLWVLFPHGIKPRDYGSVVLAVRVLERLCAEISDSGADEGISEAEDLALGLDAHPAIEVAAGRSIRNENEAKCGVVQGPVDDRTEPIAARTNEIARHRNTRPWRSIGSFRLIDFVRAS